MILKTDNPIPIKNRLKELIGDWLFISGYLIALFYQLWAFTIQFQEIFLHSLKPRDSFQLFSSSALPLTIIFAWLDYRKGNFDKRWAGLQLVYKHRSLSHSLLRSTIKLFPWQLGHMGAIRSAYQADALSIFLSTSAGILFLIFLLMGLLRKDKCHPADLLAGRQVQLKNSKQLQFYDQGCLIFYKVQYFPNSRRLV